MNDSTKTDYIAPEWSHLIDEEEVTEKPAAYSIDAPAESLAALARRYDVVSVNSIHADIEALREGGGAVIHISGRFKAQVTQDCVVSGEPVESTLEEDFEAWYSDPEAIVSLVKARHDKELERGGGESPVLEEYEDPEAIVDGKIDLGEAVAQFVSLAIDLYPHAPGARHEPGDDSEEVKASETNNPFAKLKDWKARQSGAEEIE